MDFRKRMCGQGAGIPAPTVLLRTVLVICAALVPIMFQRDAGAETNKPRRAAILPRGADEAKVIALIRICRPRRGEAFARRAARVMAEESLAQHLPPLYCAAVAYCESHFDQKSSPCVGIMQVHPPSLREYVRKRQGDFAGLDPDDWTDNIRIGVRELGMHKKKYHTLRGALGRYNGCGAGGAYISRVMSVYKRLDDYNSSEWRTRLDRGRELWR